MTANEYQTLALRTANNLSNEKLLLNGALGLCGESGEVADALKKHLFQGHELNNEKVMFELGDICWYIAITATALDLKFEDILEANIAKLRARYPNGFEAEKSINRKE